MLDLRLSSVNQLESYKEARRRPTKRWKPLDLHLSEIFEHIVFILGMTTSRVSNVRDFSVPID